MYVISQCVALASLLHFLQQTRDHRSAGHSGEIAVDIIGISDCTSRFQTRPQDAPHEHPYYIKALFEANSDAIVITDTCGIISDVSERLVEITGYPRSELIGMNWFDFFPNTVQAIVEFAKALRQNRVSNIELVIKSRDGHNVTIIYDEHPIYDCNSNLVGVLATLVIQPVGFIAGCVN